MFGLIFVLLIGLALGFIAGHVINYKTYKSNCTAYFLERGYTVNEARKEADYILTLDPSMREDT